jgi:hypothetical protein
VRTAVVVCFSDFVIRASSSIRHSSFVIRDSLAIPASSFVIGAPAPEFQEDPDLFSLPFVLYKWIGTPALPRPSLNERSMS